MNNIKKNITLIEFSKYFKGLYESRNFNKAELSRLSNVSEATLSRIESGTQQPSPGTLKKLAPYLMVSNEELMVKAGYLPDIVDDDYNKMLEQLKPNIIQLCNNNDFLEKLAVSIGAKMSFNSFLKLVDKKSFKELIELITSAGFNFNVKENNDGNVNFWLESISDLSEKEKKSLVKMKEIVPVDLKKYMLSHSPKNAIPLTDEHIIELPVYGEVRAGIGGYALQEFLGTQQWLAKNGNFKDTYMLRIKGDSMYPRFFPGDYAVVMPQRDVDSGEPAIVMVDDEEGLIKRIKKIPNGIILHSDNQLYEDREFYGEDANRVQIIGKVIDIKPGRV